MKYLVAYSLSAPIPTRARLCAKDHVIINTGVSTNNIYCNCYGCGILQEGNINSKVFVFVCTLNL